MTLDDLERQNRRFYGFFGTFGLDKFISFTRRRHDMWRWCRGVVFNTFRLKRSCSAPGLVSTAMGDCLWVGTAIGFRASRELCSNYLFHLRTSFGEEFMVLFCVHYS